MTRIAATLAGRWLELPLLDDALCTGCGWCAAVCPTECLEMDGPLPWLPRPAECVSCTLCAIVCPAQALHMTMHRDE